MAGATFAVAADAKEVKENVYFVGATIGRPRCFLLYVLYDTFVWQVPVPRGTSDKVRFSVLFVRYTERGKTKGGRTEMLPIKEFRTRYLEGKNLYELHRTHKRLRKKISRLEFWENLRGRKTPTERLSMCRRYLGETEFEMLLRDYC